LGSPRHPVHGIVGALGWVLYKADAAAAGLGQWRLSVYVGIEVPA
jgi:hypothetical protein